MSERGPVQYLDQMHEAASEALLLVHGMDEAAFAENRPTRYAVAYHLCVLSAVAAHLLERHPEFGPEHPDLDWKRLIRMGDDLLSQGSRVGAGDIWPLVEQVVPDLLFRLDSIRHWRREGE